MEEFWNTKQAAAFLGLGQSTLEAMRVRGDGPPFFRFSKRAVRYRRDDLVDWAESFFKSSE